MTDSLDSTGRGGGFPTTTWNLIECAKDRNAVDHAAAMNEFIRRYWRAVFCFLRAKGRSADQAEELTQAFFVQFLERGWLVRADPERGRFRNFVLKILVRFLSDQGPKRSPRQQSFEATFVRIGSLMKDEDRRYDPPSSETPESIFEKGWAAALLLDVRDRVRDEIRDSGRASWFDIFSDTFLADSDDRNPTQHELAERHGMSRSQVRYALDQVKSRFLETLRAEIAFQGGPNCDVDQEAREILELIGSD